jgi:hypothetical protein
MPLATQSARASTPRPTLRLLLQLEPIPASLRPLARAYVLGYASSVVPRLLALLLRHAAAKRKKNGATPVKHDHPIADSVAHIFRTALELHRFPAFCAALVGVTSLLQVRVIDFLSAYCLLARYPHISKL